MILDSAIGLAAAVCALGVAFFTLAREKRSIVRLAFVAGMLSLAAESACTAMATAARTIDDLLRWHYWQTLATAFLPGCWILFSVTYARANYSLLARRSRLLIAAAFTAPLSLVAIAGRDCAAGVGIVPETGARLVISGLDATLLKIALVFSYVIVLTNLEKTLRTSIGTMRWRIKFMVLGVGLIFVVRLYADSQNLLFSPLNSSFAHVNSAALIVGSALIMRSLLRARLLDVDLYPSPSILQRSLTLILAGIYLLLVGAGARVIGRFSGTIALPLKNFLLLLAVVSAAAVLLSDRVRQWALRFVSRHFHRPQYDYRTVWIRFSEQTASLTNVTDFCRAAAQLVSETLQALSVTIWLFDDVRQRLVLGGSTALTAAHAEQLQSGCDAGVFRQALASRPEPFNLNTVATPWAAELRRMSPDVFPRDAERICVPLMAGGEALAVMVLADRVSSHPYTHEELDLLKTIGQQIAANILSLKLSQQLAETREMEAFQSVSAFFVHDLKNTAATMSLLLRNLPKHFDDPAFREDALKAVARSVDRINDLIQRLNSLRRPREQKFTPGNLNEVVNAALRDIGAIAERTVNVVVDNVPACLMEPDEIRKVVVNLVLNAIEATTAGGTIAVSTGADTGWVWLEVRDNGCGMTPEFLNRFLFRPFCSSKPKGLGVGLFQCKTIVEAHAGRIEVQSDVGKGTVFRVLLPARLK